MAYFDWSKFGTDSARQQYTSNPAWASGEMSNQNVQQIDNALNSFRQAYKNVLGRDPNAEEIGGYAQNALYGAWNNPGDLTYSDSSSLANNYIQNTFGPQLEQYQQQKQTDQLGRTQTMVNDLIRQQSEQAVQQLQNPQFVSGLKGAYNQAGMLDSGAYAEGIANRMADAASGNISSALGAVTLPSIQGIQNTGNASYQNMLGNSNISHITDMNDFGLQSQWAQKIAEMSQPSGFEKNLGYANTASSILGNLMGGAKDAKSTSYVCKELIKRGLLCESDMDDFHVHIMPAMFKKGRAFWKYAMDGLRLVNAVNLKGLDWAVFKPLLFDRVMDEKDPCKAVDLYADACHQLCISSDRNLWDERVMRTSVWDSLPFIPMLFAYQPFREALAKSIRVKMALVYDKPRCAVHRG